MAGREESSCSSCLKTTKYTCLSCQEYFCMVCSVFEEDESVVGWKAGSSVAYCGPCFQEKMEREVNAPVNSDHPPNRKREGISTTAAASKRKRTCNGDDETDEEQDLEVDEERDGDGNDDVEEALKMFVKKKKDTKKKKPGRKPRWCPKALDDFIDIVVTNDSYKTKLIFTNSKNQHNGQLYEKILAELKARASNRGDLFQFSVPQLRSKFKKCVSFCKQAALTQKTATGIKRFQEDHGFGKWFKDLFEVVKTRDSCQPEQALEPSSTNSERSFTSTDGLGEDEDLFVPIRNAKKRQSTKEKLDATTIEVMKLVKEAVDNDPTKEMINFMREEMEKSRQHELKLFQLMLSHRANDSYQPMPSSSSTSMPFGDTCTGYYPTWNGGFGQGPSNQPRMPDGSYGPATSSPMSSDIAFGTGSYHTF